MVLKTLTIKNNSLPRFHAHKKRNKKRSVFTELCITLSLSSPHDICSLIPRRTERHEHSTSSRPRAAYHLFSKVFPDSRRTLPLPVPAPRRIKIPHPALRRVREPRTPRGSRPRGGRATAPAPSSHAVRSLTALTGSGGVEQVPPGRGGRVVPRRERLESGVLQAVRAGAGTSPLVLLLLVCLRGS